MPIYNIIEEKDKTYFRQSHEEKIGETLEAISADADASLIAMHKELQCVRDVLYNQNYLARSQSGKIIFVCLACFCGWPTSRMFLSYLSSEKSVRGISVCARTIAQCYQRAFVFLSSLETSVY